jgi:heme exporter protein D
MNLNWSSWSAFFEMGGYAPYVWGSLLMCAAALGGELWQLRLRRRALLRSVADDDTNLLGDPS